MSTQINTKTYTVSEHTKIESIVVGTNVEVTRTTVIRERGGHPTETTVTEDVRYLGEEEEFFGQFCVVDPTLPEILHKGGWFPNDEYDLISKTPFQDVLDGKPYVVVRIKSYDHTLFDVENRPLPVAMRFNYIDGGVDNSNFYMTGLADYLHTREDVTLVAPRWAEEGKFIHKIPSYNRERGRDRNLEFLWHPDVETYRRFRAELASNDPWARFKLAHKYLGTAPFRKEPVECSYEDDDD